MDTDFHFIFDKKSPGLILNSPQSIVIENNVWIGCRCTILKGTHISQGSIIAAGSIIAKNLSKPSAIYSSQGKLLRENIYWTLLDIPT